MPLQIFNIFEYFLLNAWIFLLIISFFMLESENNLLDIKITWNISYIGNN